MNFLSACMTFLGMGISLRVFFIKDIIEKKQVRIIYCPTENMLSDFFTKPIQGELFRFFKSILMGHTSIANILGINDEMKERVGKWDKYTQNIISEFNNMNKSGEGRTHCSEEDNSRTKRRKTKRTYNINKILRTTNTVRNNHDVAIGSGNL